MPRKSIRTLRSRIAPLAIAAFFMFGGIELALAADAGGDHESKFLGANSCSSSSCHGGAGAHQNQYLIWSTRDFHFQRSYATLTTARSKQIAAALQIKDATTAPQCVACHAPLHEVPEISRGDGVRISEGVSCETCHGPSENWLRSHTRPDFTHADRVASGMRDLKNLYVRANTCVACHQNVSLPLYQAGHPELIFELDGQAITEPKHWREAQGLHGAQAWAVGQAVALREMLWQLETTDKQDQKLIDRAEALLWLFAKLDSATNTLPKSGLTSGQSAQSQLHQARSAADILARDLAELTWSAQRTDSILKTLANASGDFRQKQISPERHARRAERLVLALDRLANPSPRSTADIRLKNLFALAQSIPDFKPLPFAATLENFAREIESTSIK
jgi:hypothetical protein